MQDTNGFQLHTAPERDGMDRRDWIVYGLLFAAAVLGLFTCGIGLHVLGIMAGAQLGGY